MNAARGMAGPEDYVFMPESSLLEVLLISKIGIGRNENLKASGLSHR